MQASAMTISNTDHTLIVLIVQHSLSTFSVQWLQSLPGRQGGARRVLVLFHLMFPSVLGPLGQPDPWGMAYSHQEPVSPTTVSLREFPSARFLTPISTVVLLALTSTSFPTEMLENSLMTSFDGKRHTFPWPLYPTPLTCRAKRRKGCHQASKIHPLSLVNLQSLFWGSSPRTKSQPK